MFNKLADRDRRVAKSRSRRAQRFGIERLENREMMAVANLVAYRPVTNHINYANYAVADATETDVRLGPGIRINGDNDNLNDKADFLDAGPLANPDNDLVRVDVNATGTSSQVSWSGSLALWTSPTKSGRIENNSSVSDGQQLWVEYVGPLHTSDDPKQLTQLMLTVNDASTTATDNVVFHSFRSIVLAIGGRNQNPAEFPNSLLGIFTMGGTLYNQGYDVHLFAHSDVANNGSGPAYNEVTSAVLTRDVDNVAIIGYSWGGGATYSLSNYLNQNSNIKNEGYRLVYTAYVDAFRRDSSLGLSAESRKPVGSAYHDNFYQQRDWLLKGTFVLGANNVNVTLIKAWGSSLVHTTIDDNAILQSMLVGNLMTRVIV